LLEVIRTKPNWEREKERAISEKGREKKRFRKEEKGGLQGEHK
jgi:hypothetical protein